MENIGKWSVCRLGGSGAPWLFGPTWLHEPSWARTLLGWARPGPAGLGSFCPFSSGPVPGQCHCSASPRESPWPMGAEWGCGGRWGQAQRWGLPSASLLEPPYREVHSRGPAHACRVAVTHLHRHPPASSPAISCGARHMAAPQVMPGWAHRLPCPPTRASLLPLIP